VPPVDRVKGRVLGQLDGLRPRRASTERSPKPSGAHARSSRRRARATRKRAGSRRVSPADPGRGDKVRFDLPAQTAEVDHSVSSAVPIEGGARLIGLRLLIKLSEVGNDFNRDATHPRRPRPRGRDCRHRVANVDCASIAVALGRAPIASFPRSGRPSSPSRAGQTSRSISCLRRPSPDQTSLTPQQQRQRLSRPALCQAARIFGPALVVNEETTWQRILERRASQFCRGRNRDMQVRFEHDKFETYRNLARRNLGDWYVGHLDGREIGDMGLFIPYDGVARFQKVWVYPEDQNAGLGKTIVYCACRDLAERQGPQAFLAVTEDDVPSNALPCGRVPSQWRPSACSLDRVFLRRVICRYTMKPCRSTPAGLSGKSFGSHALRWWKENAGTVPCSRPVFAETG
jgi:Acetyltransferase (GNAT) family